MRVVHVVRQFYPSVGGLESVVMELACAQLARGHELQVVTLDRLFNVESPDHLAATETVRGVHVVRIPFRGSTRYPIAPSVLKHVTSADLVHVHAIDFFFDFLAWTKPLHRKPLVVSTHGAFFHTSFALALKRVYFDLVTRLSAACYDRIVAVSEADRQLFAKIAGNVVCIENGVNIERFCAAGATTPKKRMISIGRFSVNKRLDRLVSFFGKLRLRDPDWTLVIAGRRADLARDDLASLIDCAGLGDAVRIVESPSDPELQNLMQECSVFASSSEYEGFGLAAVEAMAAGLFPLLSDIPPYQQLVSKANVGMLVDYSNAEQAAAKFLQQWQQVARNHGQTRAAAMHAAQQYEWGLVASRYLRLYDEILTARG